MLKGRYILAIAVALLVAAVGRSYSVDQAVLFGSGQGDVGCFAYDATNHIMKVCTMQTMTPTATNTPTVTPTSTPTNTPTP